MVSWFKVRSQNLCAFHQREVAVGGRGAVGGGGVRGDEGGGGGEGRGGRGGGVVGVANSSHHHQPQFSGMEF